MESESTKAYATRLPNSEAELLEEAIDETGRTNSDLVRRALRHYIAENSDQIQILYPEKSRDRFVSELVE